MEIIKEREQVGSRHEFVSAWKQSTPLVCDGRPRHSKGTRCATEEHCYIPGKRVAPNCRVVGYNKRGWGTVSITPLDNSERSRLNARTDITSLDRCHLRAEAEA